MKASVILLSWNGMDYLENCLDSVFRQDYPDFEVIVVDNGSSDGSAEFVATRYPQVRLIRSEYNRGFAGGCNIGLRAAAGDALVLLNQDTEVQPGWLNALVTALESPAVGIAGCKARYPDGSIQHAGGFVVGPRAETGHVGRYEPDDGRFDDLHDADFVTGAALAISRASLVRMGLLDEGFYPAYYEDVDWCYTAREVGFRVVYVPTAQLIHHETPTARRESQEHKYIYHHGRMRFVFKHWALERLQDEFVPAERAWVLSLGRTGEMMAARRAYLMTVLEAGTIASFRVRPDGVACGTDLIEETLALCRLLAGLRTACVVQETEGRESTWSRGRERLAELQARQMVREQPFASRVPVVGPLIAAVRQLWHNLAVRWSVLPLVHQQVRFNIQAGEMSALLLEWNADLERDMAENIREINELAERLAHLKDHVERLETAQSQPTCEPEDG